MPRLLAVSILFFCIHPMPAQDRALMKLNVVATEPKGAPVADLSAHDIQIHLNGVVCPPVFFRFAGVKREMTQLAPNEFANRPGPPVTLILLDRWNEREMTMASAWQDVSSAVGRMENVDRVYIYFLENHGNLVPVRPLPGAEADLRTPEAPPAAALVSKLGNTVRTLSGLRDMRNTDPMERADRTLQALHVVSAMAAIAGPKNLVWITHGFPIQVLNLTQQWIDYSGPLLGAAQLAVNSQVAVYTVDQSAEGAGADPAGMSRQTLELLSAETGGRWFASGRTSDALTAVTNDVRATYQLAFFLPPANRKSKDQKLHIESARKGVHLLTRAGLTGDEASTDPDEIESDVFTRQSHSPFEATEIGLRVVKTPKANGVHLEIRVDAADVFLDHEGDTYRGSLAVQFALYRDGSLEGAQPSFRQDLNFTQVEYEDAMKNGIVISRDVVVRGQMEQLRVMVFDRGIHGLGSVTLPVK